jgi:hypothetical protein
MYKSLGLIYKGSILVDLAVSCSDVTEPSVAVVALSSNGARLTSHIRPLLL